MRRSGSREARAPIICAGYLSLVSSTTRATSTSILRLYDRGLLRPGMAADIMIIDPDTVRPLPLEVVHDFPTGAKRIKEPAA